MNHALVKYSYCDIQLRKFSTQEWADGLWLLYDGRYGAFMRSEWKAGNAMDKWQIMSMIIYMMEKEQDVEEKYQSRVPSTHKTEIERAGDMVSTFME